MEAKRSDLTWLLQCLAMPLPVTAVLHHAVFFHPRCMISGFGSDYTRSSVTGWLAEDPSPFLGVALAILVYLVGRHFAVGRFLRLLAGPALVSFLPLTLWIWDVPGSARAICRWGHDGRIALPVIGTLRTLVFYLLGLSFFSLFVYLRRGELRRLRRSAPSASATEADIEAADLGI